MALERLVYYEFELSHRRPQIALINASYVEHNGKSYVLPSDLTDESANHPYRINLAFLLYTVASKMNATILLEDCKLHSFWSPEHLNAFVNYYVNDGWHEDSSIAWKLPTVEFAGSIYQFDGTNLNYGKDDVKHNGIVFCYNPKLHRRPPFMASLSRFLTKFDEVLVDMKEKELITYQKNVVPSAGVISP